MKSPLHTLTVQDVLWINLQATKKVHRFSHARLEEATFYQYAYGDSKELLGQAARFLAGFVRMRPLDAGVEATAFVATATFLEMNGARLCLDAGEVEAWFGGATVSTEAAREALERCVEFVGGHHGEATPDVRAAVRNVMQRYPAALLSPAGV